MQRHEVKGTVQQDQKSWVVKPKFNFKGENEEGWFFLEFSFPPREVPKNWFEKSSNAAYIFPMSPIHSRCRLHITGATYIFPKPLIQSWEILTLGSYIFPLPLIYSRCRLHIPGAAYSILSNPGLDKRHRECVSGTGNMFLAGYPASSKKNQIRPKYTYLFLMQAWAVVWNIGAATGSALPGLVGVHLLCRAPETSDQETRTQSCKKLSAVHCEFWNAYSKCRPIHKCM